MVKIFLAAAALTVTATAFVVVHARNAAPAQVAHSPSPITTTKSSSSTSTSTSTTKAPKLEAPKQMMGAFTHPDDDTKIWPREELEKLGLTKGPSRGAANAPVTIVVFQDNICPYCGHALGTLDQLMDEYPGKLKIIVKQFVVHESAQLSAEACYAADAQGNFWGMHDEILAHQDDLSRDALIGFAKELGLDVDRFTSALDRHEYAKQVADDMAAGKHVGVQGTPAFLINGREIAGLRPIENFRAVIDAALADPWTI